MGTIVAPTYATLVMGYLELQFYEKCKNEFGVKNGKYIEENWHRFLDDCYIALDETNINPLKLFDKLNNIYDNIKFTKEQRNLYLPFLDIMMNKDLENNNIWMDMFYKKTDTRRCIAFNSCHPKQCKKIHILHLLEEFVPQWKTTKLEKNVWMKVLYSQKYPQNLVQEAIPKVKSIPNENLRASETKTDSNNLAFVTTFNPSNKNVFPLIQTAFKSLQQSYETKECFKDLS